MDLSAPVDLYCERLGPGPTAEPLNALSNLGFLLAAAWLLLRAREAGSPPYARALAAIIFLIGLGSLSFHVFATRGTEILDTLCIAVYVHFFIACWFRHSFGWPWSRAVLPMLAFLLLNAWLAGAVPAGALNLPPLAALLLMAIALLAGRRAGGARLAAAAAVFLLSLYLRTMDMAWCPSLPIGTHWLWHCLNAITLTLVTLSLDPRRAPATARPVDGAAA
jgi:hypothetical protein